MGEARALTEWLKQLRRTRDLTQAQLAGQLGYETITVRKVEAGAAQASREFTERLAKWLPAPKARHEEFVRFVRGLAWAGDEPLPTWLVDLAAYRTAPGPATNLPAPLDPLVGRAGEVAAVRECLLAAGPRLLTLTGPGGVGKTRLALAIATTVVDRFADGVVFVPLAPLDDPRLVPAAIAQALDVREEATRALEQTLMRALRDRHLLLVLDNFEHLLAAAPLVADLLAAARRLKVLVTSRQVLGLPGEHHVPVLPLPVPPPGTVPLAAQVAAVPAVALFVERARAAAPDFALTDATAPAVVEICRRLDGLPLALELAAARIRLFSPWDLLARLDRCLPLLTGGPRHLLPRQQTVRATIDWSYELLAPAERVLFARMAVFAGGCTLEAVEAVCGAVGASVGLPPVSADVLEGLDSLLCQSLVRHEHGVHGERRFGMLETIREYAHERLQASGELEAVRDRHAAYFVGLAEQAWPHFQGPQYAEWLQRLDREQDNFRAVFRWVLDRGDAEPALRLATRLSWLWCPRAQVSEGRRWIAQALALERAQGPSVARAWALGAAATMASEQGDLAAAAGMYREALGIWRTLGDQLEIASCLDGLGVVRRRQGDPAEEAVLLEECLAINRASGRPAAVGNALIQLGVAKIYQGDFGAARPLLEEARKTFHRLGSPLGVGNACSALGLWYEEQGEYPHAQARYEESLAIRRALHHETGAARALLNVAEVLTLQGMVGPAWDRYADSLPVLLAQGDALNTARCLEGLALLAATEAAPEQALCLAGAAAALRGATLAGERRDLHKQLEVALGRARETLGAEAADRAYRAGRELPPAKAFAEAEALRAQLRFRRQPEAHLPAGA